MASSAVAAEPAARPSPRRLPSIRMNHCDVARKITGLWQRQQCGYWCVERLAMPQSSALLQRRLDVRVRVEHPLTGEQLDRVEEMAAGSDRRVDLEAIPHAGVEVVGAVTRRGVHRARALPRA